MAKAKTFHAVAGFDGGNATTILATADKQTVIDSWIGSGSLVDLVATRGAYGAALGADEHVIEMDGRSYFVGALARRESRDATNSAGDNRRYFSEHNRVMLAAIVGAHYKASEEPELCIVTGVPIRVSRELDGIKELVSSALLGDYEFTYNGQPRRFRVAVVKVIMEGLGAALAYGKANVTQGVIDIGGRTTDIAWIEAGKPILSKCDSIPLGVEAVADQVSTAFRAQHKRSLGAAELSGVLRAYAAKVPAMVMHRGEAIEVSPLVKQALGRLSGQIATFLGQKWAAEESGLVAADAAQVLLVGGGAYYFNGALTDKIDTTVRVPDAPEMGNALGYLKMANRLDELQKWGA